MKRFVALVMLSAALIAPLGSARAEDNASTYSDPAMSFSAPDGFKRIDVPPHDPARFEQKTVMAAFVKNPNTPNALGISITMDEYQGTAAGFASLADNDVRENADGAFIKRSDSKLSNGMPAVFEEVTLGSGFNQVMMYRYIWADGVRGVILSETGRYGVLDERQAKGDLAAVSAVAYPRYRY